MFNILFFVATTTWILISWIYFLYQDAKQDEEERLEKINEFVHNATGNLPKWSKGVK